MRYVYRFLYLPLLISAVLLLPGCMVGPDYHTPAAPLASQYRHAGTDIVQGEAAIVSNWWTLFNDPILDRLVSMAYRQNPNLQSAAARVLQAQARGGVARGLLLPQEQVAFGGYTVGRAQSDSYDEWLLGAAASWELDVWGRYRRGIESSDASILASIADYDDVLVTLISNVATEYLTIRTLQERLSVVRANVELQKQGLDVAQNRFEGGTATELDRLQATALLRDTEAAVPEIASAILQSEDRLCVLLGIPPTDISDILGPPGSIPTPPPSVAVGIPADLLRRRPDIRRSEHELAAQSARIGIAKSDLYPSFSLVGDVRLVSDDLGQLFEGDAVEAFAGPSFRWNVLNYGRIENSVRVQDARFQELIGFYEATVLRAQGEVESAIAGYLGAQEQALLLGDSVQAAQRAVEVADQQYRGGIADYTRVLNSQQFLQTEQDRLVTTRGAAALNLVSIYRSLGGGWDLRGDRLVLDEKIQAQMRKRTNWGNYLPVTAETRPEKRSPDSQRVD